MKPLTTAAACLILFLLIFSLNAGAATREWDHMLTAGVPTNFYLFIDQMVADGAGGCVMVWGMDDMNTYTNTVYILRLDKKGNLVWSFGYVNGAIEISYVSKKRAIYTVMPYSARNFTVVVDAKGTADIIADAGANIDTQMNSEIGPVGDKKGFYAVEERSSPSRASIVRYSYK